MSGEGMEIEGDPGIQKTTEVSAAPAQCRAARLAPRQTQPREPVREPGRSGAQAKGANGEILTRRRPGGGSTDQFFIPAEFPPPGFTYQWNVVSVLGNGDVVRTQGLTMEMNGWRPVPADRHPGYFAPVGHKGEIVVDGQRLEERPIELTNEARAEDIANARQLLSDRNEALKLTGVKKDMGAGYEMNRGKYRGTGGEVRMQIDPGLDIPAPEHTLARPGE